MERQLMKSLLFCIVSFILLHRCRGAAPLFGGLPTSVTVGEQETEDILIYTLTVTDGDNDPFNCDILSSTPAAAPFRVLKDPGTNKFGVYTNSPAFNFATNPLYTLTIECDDNTGNKPTAVLSVDILDGDRISFDNIPATTTHAALTTGDNAAIFDVDATDLLNHVPLTYTMTSIPSTTSFKIDGTTGAVTTARELKFETNAAIDLYVTVSDSSISVTEKLRVQLTNLNNVPSFTNLPATISVNENTASGTVLYTLTSYDADAGATLSYSMTVTPPADAGKFTFATNTLQLSLTAGQSFDYETRSSYTVSFTVTDTMATTGPIDLTVNINNINEACYFDKSYYYVTLAEASAGSVNYNPNFLVRDYDGAATYSLSFAAGNNSNRFSIDSSSGIVSFAVNYDIDNNAMPSNVILTVVCTDSTSVTGTAKVEITVTDVNDNAPSFPQTSYSINVDQYTTAGSLVGTIAPTDPDSGVNGEFSCAGTSTATSATTYYSIGADCGVYLLSSPSGNLAYGSISRFTITAVDKGSPALTGTTYVDIIYKETTTTTTTTTAAPSTYNFWDDSGAVAAFSIAMILGALLLAGLLYYLLRCCYTGMCCGPDPCDFMECCRRLDRPRTQRRLVTPEKPRRQKRDDFDYWREENHFKESRLYM
ncbi:cadherin EGF LAG seven-pass G-type receptor 2-like isoform X2 [Ostrea edulis]|uniref:cadherin EGF LAG seven-pass G-type receptor 2-like isoform X2 n=1 Tax=Ostrea edulis TaxID=37623 RepID=UPI002094AE45|nr:cadherin EGF LAG seven-pass G-type receptor 2-like isoform X2 [Ostrea edulis]